MHDRTGRCCAISAEHRHRDQCPLRDTADERDWPGRMQRSTLHPAWMTKALLYAPLIQPRSIPGIVYPKLCFKAILKKILQALGKISPARIAGRYLLGARYRNHGICRAAHPGARLESGSPPSFSPHLAPLACPGILSGYLRYRLWFFRFRFQHHSRRQENDLPAIFLLPLAPTFPPMASSSRRWSFSRCSVFYNARGSTRAL